MNKINSAARRDVLDFYKRLPFNSTEEPEAAAALIKKRNNVEYIYPQPEDFYAADSILEIGCGAGWFSNSIAYYYGTNVTAIDFNPDVIDKAKKTSKKLSVKVQFECADLFQYMCAPKDIVVSVGVLHHTSDCRGGGMQVHRINKEQWKNIYWPVS